MSMTSNNESVELACKSFQKSVDDLIDKIQKRKQRRGADEEVDEPYLQQDCKKLVRHANHVLRTLTTKRTSLKHAVKAFKDASEHSIQQFSTLKEGKEDQQKHILRKWFANYLRLRDGFVLLESGERRHPHDGDDAKGVNVSARKYFPSKLSDAYRRDGVTRKFSSEKGYTGAGYDEVYDEDVGIRRRLLDALSQMDGRRSRDDIRDKTFDKDGNGARIWEIQMDEHINDSNSLRGDLNSIQQKFVSDMNKHLATNSRRQDNKRGGPPDMKLVTDDKSERITLGLVDIARQGNAFTISDAGGSLPFGMTVHEWKKKFGLVQSSSQPQPNSEKLKSKKKRKVILEDSSDEDEDDVKFCKAPPAQVRKKQPKITATDDGHDGLAVRVREATDVRNSKDKKSDHNTTSINEMKRQHGVSNAQLEQGREHLEEEQLRSKMAADDEDMQEGFLGDGNGSLSNHAPLLKNCLTSRTELRKNDLYTNNMELLREAQEYWADFDDSLTQWKEHFQALLLMRKDVSNGLLDESSDRAYTIRDDFRESNITLGIDSMEVYEFFFSRLQKNQQTTSSRSTSVVSSSSSLNESLSKVCHSYLGFAEETFKTALNLVLEQEERCQANSPIMTIDKHWEKGQHFLLRGRAHHNIGRAMYELAQYYENTPRTQQTKHNRKHLLTKARKEFDNAVLRAKSLRRNAVLIHGHANAQVTSTQNNCSWRAEGMIHTLEAIKLESLASGYHVACSWKLDLTKEAEKRFDGFFESVVTSDILEFASIEGVTHDEIAEVLDNMYWFGMRTAELFTQSLESMPTKNGWNAKTGEKLLQMTRTAMKRAASISDQLLLFVNQHSLNYVKERIGTRAAIEKEESEICKWWETTKAQAQKKLSDVVQSARANNDVRSALPRNGIGGEIDAASRAAPLPRRIFIQDDRALQGRSLSCRTRSVKKNSTEDRTAMERFNSEFGSDNNNFTTGGTSVPMGVEHDNATIIYRKWGDEVLEDHERKRCCPPLPDGLSVDVRRALEKKLRGILPTNGQYWQVVTNDQSY